MTSPGFALLRDVPRAARVLALLFLAIAAPLGTVMATITPLGQVADEVAHGLRALALLHGQGVGRRVVMTDGAGRSFVAAGVDVDTALVQAMSPMGPHRFTTADVAAGAATPWLGREAFVELTPIAIYPPQFYVPAAIGIAVAKVLGYGPAAAAFVGRFADLASYLLAGTAALLLARRGRVLIFCALSFPMTLSLAASLNPDGQLIAASALAAALLSRGTATAARPLRRPAYLLGALLVGAIVLAKPPYAPLCALLLVPLRGADRGIWRDRLLVLALILVPTALWALVTQHYVAGLVQHAAAPAGPLWPGAAGEMFHESNPALQIRVLLVEPLRFLSLPWVTITHDPWLLKQMIGALGWLTVLLPDWTYRMWMMAIGLAGAADMLGRRDGRLVVRWDDTLFLAMAAAACVLGIYVSQYLVWTAIGLPRIEGPQGRYLTPLLSMLALALPRFRLSFARIGRPVLTMGPVAAAALGFAVLPPVILAGFYLW